VALIAVTLLADRHAVLDLPVAVRLLASDHALLLTVEARPRLLALGVLLALRPHHGVASMAAAAPLRLHSEGAAAVAVASATAISLHALPAATAAPLRLGSLAAAALSLSALAAAIAVTLRDGAAAIAVTATWSATTMWPRCCRDRDRQRGNAGCEEDPGHNIISFERKNGPFAAPFQRLDGWTLQPRAPG
jgi:hypothetical protein